MVLCTMSPARLTALLLLVPMAMATCPCPPVLQSSKVCGSNSVTYDSQCALDCAAVQQPDATQVAKCMAQNNCIENTISCGIRCGADDECNAKCALDNFDCQCKCNGSLSLRPTLGVAVALLSAWLIRTIG
ncbi:hypothetical protein FOCC_FOCC010916 [Frankliniella occidentalis]|nr:hypothetical protein FOCC_FOCC010916 [Frankliniella occidentalis]